MSGLDVLAGIFDALQAPRVGLWAVAGVAVAAAALYFAPTEKVGMALAGAAVVVAALGAVVSALGSNRRSG